MDTNTITILGVAISLGYLIVSQSAATRKEHREDFAAIRADLAKINENLATINVKLDALIVKVDALIAKFAIPRKETHEDITALNTKVDNIHKDVAGARTSIARIEGHLFGLEKPAVAPAEQPTAAATR